MNSTTLTKKPVIISVNDIKNSFNLTDQHKKNPQLCEKIMTSVVEVLKRQEWPRAIEKIPLNHWYASVLIERCQKLGYNVSFTYKIKQFVYRFIIKKLPQKNVALF